MQTYSEQARYEGFLQPEIENEIQKDNFKECVKLLEKLKKYFKSNGVTIEEENLAA